MSSAADQFEQYYRQTHPANIPWENIPFGFIKSCVADGSITPGTVLDVGCGTGNQALWLAGQGFEVTGVDISQTAIDMAGHKMQKAGVTVRFLVGDALHLDALNLPTNFSLVLDWALLHTIPVEERKRYVEQIHHHLHPDGKVLLRVFSHRDPENKDEKHPSHLRDGSRYFFSREDIERLYGPSFRILLTRERLVEEGEHMRFFDEYLLECTG